MSSGGNWWSGRDYGANVPNILPAVSPSLPLRASSVTSVGAQNPRWPLEERATSGPSSLRSFPVQPHPPVQILVLNNDRAREASPRRRQFVYESPSGVGSQRNMQVPTKEESRLTQEQKKALKKLRSQIYNPIPKRILKTKMYFYYRDLAIVDYNEKAKEYDEDDKRCAICLEDFRPKEEVMLTPCSHMFHEDCIVPWVKDHNQCPVCRFAI